MIIENVDSDFVSGLALFLHSNAISVTETLLAMGIILLLVFFVRN